MGCLKGGYDIAGIGGGEFALWLVPRQRAAPLYWRSSSHTHVMLYHLDLLSGVAMVLLIYGPLRLNHCTCFGVNTN